MTRQHSLDSFYLFLGLSLSPSLFCPPLFYFPLCMLLALFSCTPAGGELEGESACLEQVLCQGQVAVRCPGGEAELRQDCAQEGGQCFTGIGCLACEPGAQLCEGETVVQCASDGLSVSPLMTCELACARGRCVDPCEEAAAQSSYMGCEYWPTPIMNAVGPRFKFAVAVANPHERPVNVSVSYAGLNIDSRSVAPQDVEVFELDWIEGLSQPTSNFGFSPSLTTDGAYRLTSEMPVTAYQFNPLRYELPQDCPESSNDEPDDGRCYSYTNDASLLLPTHALGQDYLVMTYGSHGILDNGDLSSNPSSFQVVATAEGSTEVRVQFSAHSKANMSDGIRAYRAGEEGVFQLSQGQVLQLFNEPMTSCTEPVGGFNEYTYCGEDPLYDFSGTTLHASQPVQVFGSHPCAFVPYRYFACDHLEESLFPTRAWGRSAVVSATRPQRSEPNLIRVFSASDNNQLTFTPAVQPPTTLNAGEWLQFETRSSFRVVGSGSLQVAQFLVGQAYNNEVQEDLAFGDPAMSLVPPEDQFRRDYTFLTPDSYAQHFVNIVAPTGASVTLDGSPVSGFNEIEGTGWSRVNVEVGAGAHNATSDQAFGVWVYGFGSFTSYLYPGGLDLRPISDVMY